MAAAEYDRRVKQRKLLIAANWKMNSPPQGWDAEGSPYKTRDEMDIVVFPTFVDIRSCLEKFLAVGGQYGRSEPQGAFTGDVSMKILASHGCTYVLCGHSERRKYHGETDEIVAAQVQAALEAGLHPIVCVGESLEEREAELQHPIVERQVRSIESPVIFAYEPVWAIGTGKTATAEQAQEMHAFIRSLLPEGAQAGTRILYGGSANDQNAAELLAQDDIDGLLVGGASLKPETFAKMIESAASL
jgi:triosephosphate isomerase